MKEEATKFDKSLCQNCKNLIIKKTKLFEGTTEHVCGITSTYFKMKNGTGDYISACNRYEEGLIPIYVLQNDGKITQHKITK